MTSLSDSTIVWDAHAGIFPTPEFDLNLLGEWYDAGFDHLSINVGFDVMSWDQTMATLAAYRNWLLANSDRFVISGTVADIVAAKQAGKMSIAFDIEGMNALNGDINMVSVYHALGVRQMLFAYNLNNDAAGGCHDEDMGLTDFGKAVVREMNRLGMLVDCSHAAYRTTMDIMAESSGPCVFTHSNPTSLCDHQRNITDEQMKRCAETGGVIGVNGMGIFLGDNDISNETVLTHICYMVDLVGAEHVGLGLDYSPRVKLDVGEILASRPDFWPAGNRYDTPNIGHVSPAQFTDLKQMMADKGFKAAEINGILGDNFRRVAEVSWGG